MAEPTSVYSHYDLLLRVAETAGVAFYGSGGAEKALIPIDEHDFAKCKRVVNDGVKMFIGDAPTTGWRWKNRIMAVTFATVETTGTVDSGSSTTLVDDALESTHTADSDINGYYVYDLTQEIYALVTGYTASGGTVTVVEWLDYDDVVSSLTPADGDSYSITNLKTVEGDKARYWLDEDFGRVSGKITYAKDENRGHLLGWVNESAIRVRREITVNSGNPIYAAVRPYRNQRRWELIVDPSPTEADIINFPYEVGFDELQMEIGTSNAGATASLTDVDLVDLYPDNYFKTWIIRIISGTGKGSYAPVTAYANSTGIFTVADWLSRSGSAGGKDPGTDSVYYVEPAFNKHPAGISFDQVVVSACLAQAEMQFDDIQSGHAQKYYSVDLPRAQEADARTAPRRLGKMLHGGGYYDDRRGQENVTYNTS